MVVCLLTKHYDFISSIPNNFTMQLICCFLRHKKFKTLRVQIYKQIYPWDLKIVWSRWKESCNFKRKVAQAIVCYWVFNYYSEMLLWILVTTEEAARRGAGHWTFSFGSYIAMFCMSSWMQNLCSSSWHSFDSTDKRLDWRK